MLAQLSAILAKLVSVKSTVDTNLNATIDSRAAASSWTPTLATNLGTVYSRTDKTMSTRLRAPVVTVYSSAGATGTYNRRESTSYVRVTVLGGGGGGGGGGQTTWRGGGGGGGERVRAWLRLTADPDYRVANTAAGGASGNNGTDGDYSLFGWVYAMGGIGGGLASGGNGDHGMGGGVHSFGKYDNGTVAYAMTPSRDGHLCGGAGHGYAPGWPFGTGNLSDLGGQLNMEYNTSNSGRIYTATNAAGGYTEYGAGGVSPGSTGVGGDATGYGAGGAGGYGANAGGLGTGGILIIEDFGNIDSGN